MNITPTETFAAHLELTIHYAHALPLTADQKAEIIRRLTAVGAMPAKFEAVTCEICDRATPPLTPCLGMGFICEDCAEIVEPIETRFEVGL